MKGYLLFGNEETRENFLPMVWETVKCSGNEIEIPDGAVKMFYGFWDDGGYPAPRLNHSPMLLPIPRPKKVKKTVYLYVQNHNGKAVYSVFDGKTAPSKAYPVEIEVEE